MNIPFYSHNVDHYKLQNTRIMCIKTAKKASCCASKNLKGSWIYRKIILYLSVALDKYTVKSVPLSKHTINPNQAANPKQNIEPEEVNIRV